ncbi:hypothetical protein OIO90_002386 [Microbotryomycetes sp. JL221]|nr:hypothetical protein OIO90_002386 [Microbotryomycetes sp. JL221]
MPIEIVERILFFVIAGGSPNRGISPSIMRVQTSDYNLTEALKTLDKFQSCANEDDANSAVAATGARASSSRTAASGGNQNKSKSKNTASKSNKEKLPDLNDLPLPKLPKSEVYVPPELRPDVSQAPQALQNVINLVIHTALGCPGCQQCLGPMLTGYQDEDEEVDPTYMDGLPANPLLPFSLVGLKFCQAARSWLYRRIVVTGPWQAELLLRTLKAPQPAIQVVEGKKISKAKGKMKQTHENINSVNDCAKLVKSISFEATVKTSIERGNARVYLGILSLCSNVEELTFNPRLVRSATGKFLQALASLPSLKSFRFMSEIGSLDELKMTPARLLKLMWTTWTNLKTLIVKGLESDRGISTQTEVDDAAKLWREQLHFLLSDSAESLRELSIDQPLRRLDPPGLARLLLTNCDKLTRLELNLPIAFWDSPPPTASTRGQLLPKKRNDYKVGHPTTQDIEMIVTDPFLLDVVIQYLPHLVKLKFTGPVASEKLFTVCPPTLKFVEWHQCPAIRPDKLANVLKKSVSRHSWVEGKNGQKSIKYTTVKQAPGLKSIRVGAVDHRWYAEAMQALEAAANARHIKLEYRCKENDISPGSDVDDNDSDEDSTFVQSAFGRENLELLQMAAGEQDVRSIEIRLGREYSRPYPVQRRGDFGDIDNMFPGALPQAANNNGNAKNSTSGNRAEANTGQRTDDVNLARREMPQAGSRQTYILSADPEPPGLFPGQMLSLNRFSEEDAANESLKALTVEHQELNSSSVAVLHETPTAAQFASFVIANRPVLIKRQQSQGISNVDSRYNDSTSITLEHKQDEPWHRALTCWTNKYLCDKMGNKKLKIAVTPDGRADSITSDGLFVEPAIDELSMIDFLAKLDPPVQDRNGPTHYLQSQNDNLGEEYEALREDVGTQGPAFARQIFGAEPDVSNIWIGDNRSVTSLHKDPYENIYFVVRGSKHFKLLSPTASAVLDEQQYPHATWSFSSSDQNFKLEKTEPEILVPWINIDFDQSAQEQIVNVAHVLTVDVEAGDMLYLPALWYHQVSQSVGPSPPSAEDDSQMETKATIAINWWYDMDMSAPLWSLMQFVRRCKRIAQGQPLDENDSHLDD